ncbi:Serine O-succinyltransferase like protein [Verticillium longisporum]|uniref:Serine O-succinyltransferase like protein n=1 Tax=Verticillium longisporum TaxID=100787 RepID=A0A8I3AY03_VERLO|nr:Serine O-succinyltransferase like protein [Verticillium longisporum]
MTLQKLVPLAIRPLRSSLQSTTRAVVTTSRPATLNLRQPAQHARCFTSKPPKAAAGEASNPAMAFPCLDALETRSATLRASFESSGPEPSYTSGATQTYHCQEPLVLDWGGMLPEFKIAYETWGEMNADKSNVILLHTGLSASSHAHSTEANPAPGWWEKFIGPGGPLNTDKYHVICTNVIGGCYGSTGPSSTDPADGQHYATRFPILTMEDMAMDLFDLGRDNQRATRARRAARERDLASGIAPAATDMACSLTLPEKPYEEQPESSSSSSSSSSGGAADAATEHAEVSSRPPEDLIAGLATLRDTPTLVMGVASDILFPAWQQREVAEALKLAGNRNVAHYELSEEMSMFGHDTFLLDLKNIGGNLKNFLG